MGVLAGGGGGLPGLYLPRLRGCPSSRGVRLGPPQLFPNCRGRGWARGGSGGQGPGFGVQSCVWTLEPRGGGESWGGGDGGGKTTPDELQSRYLRSGFLFCPATPSPLPEQSLGGETRILTKLAFTFLGGCSPRLDLADTSFFALFLFLESGAL